MNDQQLKHRRKAVDTEVDAIRKRAALIDISFEPIFVWELDGAITEWNAGAEMLYGFTRSEAIGRRGHDLLRSVHPIPLNKFLDLLRAKGHWSGEIRQFTKDGREVLVESRQQVIESAGRPHVVEINRPITE